MKILSITAQKPHSTGSGTYMTELVRAFDRMGHSQAVVCGIFPDDPVEFPAGVSCYPVFFADGKPDLLVFDWEDYWRKGKKEGYEKDWACEVTIPIDLNNPIDNYPEEK